MSINSKAKGAAGEREAAHEIARVWGIKARRGVQYQGGPDSPDVVGINGVHVEVKRVQALNVPKAMARAVKDAGYKWPLLLHRRNHGDWLVTVRMADLLGVASMIDVERKNQLLPTPAGVVG